MPVVVIDGIRPHEVAENTFFGDLHKSVDLGHVLESDQIGRDASVDAEELAVENAGDRQLIECFHDAFVEHLVIFVEAFVS